MSARDKHKPECVEYGRDWPEKEAAPCICRRVGKVGCITCEVYSHPANMVNIYDGEYQCQECRWGL